MPLGNTPSTSLDDWAFWLRNNARTTMSPEGVFNMLDTFVWSWLRKKVDPHV